MHCAGNIGDPIDVLNAISGIIDAALKRSNAAHDVFGRELEEHAVCYHCGREDETLPRHSEVRFCCFW